VVTRNLVVTTFVSMDGVMLAAGLVEDDAGRRGDGDLPARPAS
jgi:hypothetical protein